MSILKNSKTIIPFNPQSKFDDATIHHLSVLKPAGTRLILEPKTDLVELIKLTLFDLALKQVLIIKKILRRSHQRDPHLREYVIVETGKNFKKYRPSRFENYFVAQLGENGHLQLRLYLKRIYKEIPSAYKHKIEIIESLSIRHLFNDSLLQSVFSMLRTNRKGKELKTALKHYLNEVDQDIGQLITDEPKKALELILFLQGNIFLLKNLKFDLIERLKPMWKTRTKSDDENGDWFWIEMLYDPDVNISDMFNEVIEFYEGFDDYFSFDSEGNWDTGFDGDIDL